MIQTLRQAARLTEEISARSRALSPALDISLAADETAPAAAVARARDKVRRQEVDVRALEEVLGALRQAVGRAKAETGISDLLAEYAVLLGHLARLQARAKARPYAGHAQAEAAVSVSVWTADEVAEAGQAGPAGPAARREGADPGVKALGHPPFRRTLREAPPPLPREELPVAGPPAAGGEGISVADRR